MAPLSVHTAHELGVIVSWTAGHPIRDTGISQSESSILTDQSLEIRTIFWADRTNPALMSTIKFICAKLNFLLG